MFNATAYKDSECAVAVLQTNYLQTSWDLYG